MNVIGSLRKQLSAFDSKGAADEKPEIKVVENQRFNPATERWSFKNLTQSDPKRFSSEIGETDQFPSIPLPAGWEYSGLWEIDYNYHDELSGEQKVSSTSKPRANSDARSEAPADLDPDESGEWVYSSSFEDLARGVLMECSGSSSNTPMLSPIREDQAESPPSDNSLSDSLRAALEAEYDLPADASRAPVEAVALVRQRRYKRIIVRARKPGEPAAAMLQAKGAAVVGSAGKMLSTTNKFLADVAESNKKDIAKLVNVAKDKINSSKSNASMGSSVHGSSADTPSGSVSVSPVPGGESEVEEGSDAVLDANTASNGATSNTPVLSPSPVPNSSTSAGASAGVSGVKSPPARVQSFTSRMFGSLSGSNNNTTTPTPAARPLPITPPQASSLDKGSDSVIKDLAASHISSPTDSSVSPTIDSTNTSANTSANTSTHTSPRGQTTIPVNSKQDLSRRNTTDTNVSSDSNTDSAQNPNLLTSNNANNTANTAIPTNNNTTAINNPVPANDTFDMEVDMDGADFDNNSEIGDMYSDTMSVSGHTTDYNPHTVGGVASSAGGRSTVEKRKSTSYFGSIFGSSASTNADTTTTTTAAPLPPIDPIFKVISPALASLGKQLRNVEAQSTKEQDNNAREWRNNVKPVLEVEIAQLEKQAAALMLQIEREANKGINHINSLETLLKDITTEMDVKKRKYHLPDSTITLGSGGVYVGLNDFWLQQLSGHFSVCLHPKKDGSPSEITIVLTGKKHTSTTHTNTSTTSATDDGVTVQFRAEGFKLVGDRGKKVPKLSFDNLKLAVSLTLSLTLTFDHNTKKWLLPGKNFNLRILSFKGPYGINRSMVGMILSLVTPMIRTAIATAIPHEVGMLLHSLPTDFSLRGEFDLRGMDMTILSTDFHKCDTMMELSGYSPQQLEMFVLMQRAMERSTIIRNLADLITYRRKYAAHTELYSQLLLIWAECCITYCELVITAKMEQLIEQSSGSINPFSMSIKFDVFMTACDDICHKRTTAKCAIQYVDGQISLNELLQFVFQVQHRLASDELSKSSGLRKVRLTTLIESLQAQFSLARALVALVVQNFDFAHLTIVGDVRSGPFGQANVKVAELLAQMPMFLNLSIMEDKNIGALSLVPYILSFKPQENGDVCLELYSFTQDVALPDTTHHTLPVTLQPKPYDKALQAEQEHQLQQALALEKDSIGQCYSTNYNKLLNAITLNRAVGNSRHHLHPMYDPVTQSINTSQSHSNAHTPTHGIHSNYSDSGTPRKHHSRRASYNALSTLHTPITTTSANAHLSVKHNELHKALHHTLHDYPTGEESDTICTIVASNPHISVIVDQAVKLAAGTELLTIIIGPKVKTWKPLGKATLLNDGPAHADDHPDTSNNTADNTTTDHTANNTTTSGGGGTGNNILDNSGLSGITNSAGISGGVSQERPSFDFGSREDLLSGTHMGCPIKVQTAPGIKMLTQVERADVDVNLPGLIRFLLAHFRDVPLLKEYLEIFVGGVFMVEHLNIYKIIIEKVAKYLLLPGIELDINLNIRIVVKDAQILVRVETPDQVVSVQEQGGGGLDLNADNLARLATNNTTSGASAGGAGAGAGVVGKSTSRAGSVHGSGAGGSSKNLHLHNPANNTHINANNTNNANTTPAKLPNSAVNLAAEISVQDLINDIAEVMEHVKVFFEPAVSENGRN